MEVQTVETRTTGKKPVFPWISWGAIFAGLASGLSSYLLLALLGLAAGLSAVNPQSGEPLGKVPLLTAAWTGISLILSAFVGGYVAARMSGLSRIADGLLHGFVAWGASTLLFAYFLSTSVGSAVGGAFGIIGQGAKTLAGGAAVTAGGISGSKSAQGRLEALLKGSAGGGGNISTDSVKNLQRRFSAGDRDGAIDVMVNQMGFTQDRATQLADQGMALFGSAQNLPQNTRDIATSAVSGLTKVSWALFVAVLLSAAVGVAGGAVGAKATVKRRHPIAH